MSLRSEPSGRDDPPRHQDHARPSVQSGSDMRFEQDPPKTASSSSYSYSYSHQHTNGYVDQTTSASSSTPHVHGAAGSTTSIRERIGDYLQGQSDKDLPMYKDKPQYPRSRRRGSVTAVFPRGRRQRWACLGLVVLALIWLSGITGKAWRGFTRQEINWTMRRDLVRQVFVTSWEDYAKNAWGMDEYHPVSRRGAIMVKPQGQLEGTAGAGWIIVDGLDTAILMNLTKQVAQARDWIRTSLDFSRVEGEISTFETTIRVLGGLLSAHYLSTTFPSLAPQSDDDRGATGEDLYIEKAVDLADRLLGAFDTPTGIPLSSVNLNTSAGIASRDVGGIASTAEAATLQLELKYLSKLTGEPLYWEKAEKVMEAMDKPHMEAGLLPIYISPRTGDFHGHNIRLGSRGDSYYEYLVKQFLQTGGRESIYDEMWEETLEGMKRHLVTWSPHANFTILGERENGLHGALSGKMDHLVCFLPGTIALAVTGGQTVEHAKNRMGRAWGRKQEENLVLAEELMKTCWGMYRATPTQLAAEITFMQMDQPPRRWDWDDPNWTPPRSTVNFEQDDEHRRRQVDWKRDFDVHPNDVHNLQRPETVESLFYLHRITRNEKYRDWGWTMFQAFKDNTAVYDAFGQIRAYSSLDNVMARTADVELATHGLPGGDKVRLGHKLIHGTNYVRDNMEGFWMAETLKYFYLLFGDQDLDSGDWNDLSKVVINTEAHFFPRFDIQGSEVWKTGWTRTERTTKRAGERGDANVKPDADVAAPAPGPDDSSAAASVQNPNGR